MNYIGVDLGGTNIVVGLINEDGKICFNKANLICYSHGEYFALNSKPLGSFGYSIKKRKKKRTTK